MVLSNWLNELEYTLIQGNTDIQADEIIYDSRKAGPGTVFVAMTGTRIDAHCFIPDVLKAGTRILVTERSVEVEMEACGLTGEEKKQVTILRVSDARRALALLSAARFGYPAKKLTMIGVTGTKGKTTTTHMIKAILEAAGKKVGLIGTTGVVIGDHVTPTMNTTPESYELHKAFAQMAEAGCTHAVGIIMVYPLIWMVGASFKTNSEIFSSVGFIPKNPVITGYVKGFAGYEGMTLLHFMANTYKIVLPKVIVTLVSATITAYGFARFDFFGKKFSFAVLMSTLFLPQVVLNVPQYILFNELGWLDSYLPLVVPSILAGDTYFVYMLIQFQRGIPRELEEAAQIDGCSIMKTLWYVLVPMLKPAIVSCGLFQFMWASNDFMGPLIYVNTVAKFPVSIFLRMSMEAEVGFEWNRVLAMSLLAIIPSLVVFFSAQNSFVDGIAAGGVKG